MSDPDPGAGVAAAPKKRSFFKKAAWQTAPKAEERDMFSHSNEFRDVVTEQTQRRNEEKQKAEEERKRTSEGSRERKKRKVSVEDEAVTPSRRRLGSSSQENKVDSSRHSKTSLSPTRNDLRADTLSSRYDSLTKSSSNSSFAQNESNTIDLGDSDDDYIPTYRASRTPPIVPIQQSSVYTEPLETVEEVEDPALAALKAKARARAAERASKQDQASPSTSTADQANAVPVLLFINSTIPNTSPLQVKIRTNATISRAKEAWCTKQGFDPEQTRDVFMTFRKIKTFDSTTIQRLGLRVHDNGCVTMEGDPTIYDETNPAKVYIEAWTEETFQEWKREEAEEAGAKKRATDEFGIEELEPEVAPEAPRAKRFRLFLKAKGREVYKVEVKPDTEFGHLTQVYKTKMGVPGPQPITLMFDGERLPPMDTVADTEIEDMDTIEVHFK